MAFHIKFFFLTTVAIVAYLRSEQTVDAQFLPYNDYPMFPIWRKSSVPAHRLRLISRKSIEIGGENSTRIPKLKPGDTYNERTQIIGGANSMGKNRPAGGVKRELFKKYNEDMIQLLMHSMLDDLLSDAYLEDHSSNHEDQPTLQADY